jgi:EKC/KEOPS complex subunit CGI121/TPRKB
VIKISTTAEITHESVVAHLGSSVQGTAVPFDDQTLFEISDINKIKKAYKFGALPSPSKAADQACSTENIEVKQRLENALLGAIALRGS